MPLRGWLGGRAPSRLLPRWCGLFGWHTLGALGVGVVCAPGVP